MPAIALPGTRVMIGNRALGYVSIPQYLLSNAGSCIEGFENHADWTVSSGSRAGNTTEFIQGAQSVKFTQASTNQRVYKNPVANWNVSAFERAYIWIYAHNVFNHITMRLYADAGYTKYINLEMTKGNLPANTGAMLGRGIKREATLVGMAWTDPIVAMRLEINATGVTNFSIDNLILNAVGSSAAVVMVFDDCYTSHYSSVYPIMKAHRMRGTIGVISTYPDTGGFTSWAQLQEMYEAGWSIANHGDTNTPSLAGQDLATQTSRIETCITALEDHNMTRDSHYLIFPQATYDSVTFQAMANLNIPLGRGVGDATTNPIILPYPDLRNVCSYTINDTKSLATVIGFLDRCITDKSVLVMHFHNVGGSGEWTTATFQTFVEYVAAKAKQGLVYPLTMDDFYKLHLGSVTIPKVI
jgi:peptidoglycan/xylan/chitin deacetylase (PgdA/CDA1 family)